MILYKLAPHLNPQQFTPNHLTLLRLPLLSSQAMDSNNRLDFEDLTDDQSQQPAFGSQFSTQSSQWNPYGAGGSQIPTQSSQWNAYGAGYAFPPHQQYQRPPFYYGNASASQATPPMASPVVEGSFEQRRRATRSPPAPSRPSWSVAKDLCLCQAWLRVTEDLVVGTNQHRSRMWERVHHEFVAIRGKNERNANGLMNRWATLHLRLNKFSGYYQFVERSQISGISEKDMVC